MFNITLVLSHLLEPVFLTLRSSCVVTLMHSSPLPRRNHSITCLGSSGEALAVFGGATTGGLPSNDIFILAVDTWTWFKVSRYSIRP